jgi:prepilin-type N-terminal cleavage/methylation domain-containing protein
MLMNRQFGKAQGFSLIEMLIVCAILSLVLGAIFNTIQDITKKYKTEESRVNETQESREFLDQIVRDLHTSGYPNTKMYMPATLGVNPLNNSFVAAGLVAVSSTDVWFEGDVDGSGTVQSIRYTLQADANGNCPCTMRRSAVPKVAAAPTAQALNYDTQLQNVINSLGANGVAYTIAGNTVFASNAPAVANDVLYGAYKTVPVFAFFDAGGNPVAVPPTLAGGNLANGQAAAPNVRMLSVSLNLLAADMDLQTKIRPTVSMRAMVKINNL